MTEVGMDRVPRRALASLVENVDRTGTTGQDHPAAPDLPQQRRPCSRAGQRRELQAYVGTSEVEERVLDDCYHVATLDNEAEAIFAGSVEFMRQHTRASVPSDE